MMPATKLFKTPNTNSLRAKPLYCILGSSRTNRSPVWWKHPPHSQTAAAEYSPEQSYWQDKHQGVPFVCASLSSVCQSTPPWPPLSRSSPHTSGHIKHSKATATMTWDDTHSCTYTHTVWNIHVHKDVYRGSNTDTLYRWSRGGIKSWRGWLGGHSFFSQICLYCKKS